MLLIYLFEKRRRRRRRQSYLHHFVCRASSNPRRCPLPIPVYLCYY